MKNVKKILRPVTVMLFLTIVFVAFQNFSNKSKSTNPAFDQCGEQAGVHSFVTVGFNLPIIKKVFISEADIKNVKSFSQLIQKFIDSETTENPRSVTQIIIPSGNYHVDGTIELKSGVWLKGSGIRGSSVTVLTLKRKAKLTEYETPMMPVLSMFFGSGKNNIGLSDMIIDMNGRNHESFQDRKARAHTALALLNVSNSDLNNLIIKDFGKTPEHPGGQGILLTATENGGSFENKFSNIKISDNALASNFGLRALSNWKSETPDELFQAVVSDNLFENFIINGTMWNAVEIAGPGTQHNTIKNMKFKNYLTAFEADKGAKYNLYSDNTVLSLKKRPGKRKVIIMRDQGMPAHFHANNPERFAIGNEFINNHYNGNKDGSEMNIAGQNASMMRVVRNKCLKLSNNNAVIKTIKNYQQASMLSVGPNSDLESMSLNNVTCVATDGVHSQGCIPQFIEEEEDLKPLE